MAKPNPGQSRGKATSNVKSYSGSVGALPTGTKTTGGAKGSMNLTAKSGTLYQKGKGG